jgi:uncharacterized Zn finger protein
MSYWNYRPYRSVAAKRADAKKAISKLTKQGGCSPVVLEGTKIASSFWGKAWCKHIEGWQDYENRLPRGRSYVRSGAVVDLRLAAGEITAKVQGSELYNIRIAVTKLPPARWKTFKQLSLGKVGSLLSLMQGRLPDELLEQLTDPETGLFPRKKEMKLDCDCPDYSSLCKHLAAVLYGVGNRLDSQPELLFTLRGVDHSELLSQAAGAAADLGTATLGNAALATDDLGAIFGIELATPAAMPAKSRKPKIAKPAKKVAKKATAKTAKKTVAKTARKAATPAPPKPTAKKAVKKPPARPPAK